MMNEHNSIQYEKVTANLMQMENIQEYIGKSASQVIAKRALDISASILFFIFFGWIYILVWAGVILTTGSPAIYRHTRIGMNGREFNCLKFRSMVTNSAEILKKYLDENPVARAEWDKDFKLRNDPRITKFGRIIRKTSLDELPQFWNVLRGDMSLVGPRPVIKKELDIYYKNDSFFYKRVKPGITGPWQVGGRNDLNYEERIKLDTDYSKNWTLLGDLEILFKTVLVVVARRGSY
jgi:exopolysaccharide production protein ExoY